MNEPANPYMSPVTESETPFVPGRSYGGIGRLAYFGYTFLAAILYQVVLLGVAAAAGGAGGPDGNMVLLIGTVISFLVYMGVLLFIVAQRVTNLGSNPWWCLGMLVPFLNILVGLRCLICPEGYTDHKTLDTPGKIIGGIFVAFILLIVGLGVIAAFGSA